MLEKLIKLLKIKFEGTLTLLDGTPIVLDGELDKGVGIMLQSSSGRLIDLPTGSYELSSGEIISVENGIIVDVVEELINKPSPDPGTNLPHGHGPMENHPPDQEYYSLNPDLTPVEDTGNSATGTTKKQLSTMTPEEIQKLIDELTARVLALEEKIASMETGAPTVPTVPNPVDTATAQAAQSQMLSIETPIEETIVEKTSQELAIEKLQADIEVIMEKAIFSKEITKYEDIDNTLSRADILKQYRRK